MSILGHTMAPIYLSVLISPYSSSSPPGSFQTNGKYSCSNVSCSLGLSFALPSTWNSPGHALLVDVLPRPQRSGAVPSESSSVHLARLRPSLRVSRALITSLLWRLSYSVFIVTCSFLKILFHYKSFKHIGYLTIYYDVLLLA